MKSLFPALSILAVMVPALATADDKPVVSAFYELLTMPSASDLDTKIETILSDNWTSIGDYSGKNKSRDMFLKQLGGFGKLIPNLNWSVQEIIKDGNRYVVRSRATGTPSGPFFGVDGKGKSFDILAIDIHTVENGKIVQSYHVEDWAGALKQLKSD